MHAKGITGSIKVIKEKNTLYPIYLYLKDTFYNLKVVTAGRVQDLERCSHSLFFNYYYFQNSNLEFQR